MAKQHKLNPWPLDESQRPKDGKLRLNLHGTILEGKNSIQTQNLKGELTIWKTKMQAKVQGKVQLKYSRIQFVPNESKLVRRDLDPGPHLKWALVL